MTLSSASLKRIADRAPGTWDWHYIKIKLATDPVYAAVARELSGSTLPLLDIGCGIGLVAHYLREAGHAVPVTGIDFDPRKIASAQAMAADMKDCRYTVGDARRDLPDHHGHVIILDILQFFQPTEQDDLLRSAASRVAPGGKLIIRSGLADGSWRHRVTALGDWFAKVTFWMKSGPVGYPTTEQFQRVLGDAGLHVTFTPLWGKMPFNNYLIVAEAVR
jgi:SAM-dependent methyltransferase